MYSMQCACAILSSVSCLVLPLCSTLYHKRHDFWKDVVEHNMCVLIAFPNLSGTLLFATRIQQDITINVLMSSSKVPVSLVRFQWILNIIDTFLENSQASSSMKSHPLKPCFSMRTDGGREVPKIVVAFRNFANAPQNDALWQIRRR